MTNEYLGSYEPQSQQGYPPQQMPQPQGYSPQQMQQPQGYSPQQMPQPQSFSSQQIEQPQGFSSQQMQPSGYPPQQMQQPQGYPPQQPQGYPQQGYPQQTKSAVALIVLSVLEILFAGGLLAIVPLVFAIQANSAYKMGDNVTGDAKAKVAKIWLIVLLILAIILFVAMFATGAFTLSRY